MMLYHHTRTWPAATVSRLPLVSFGWLQLFEYSARTGNLARYRWDWTGTRSTNGWEMMLPKCIELLPDVVQPSACWGRACLDNRTRSLQAG